MQGNFQIASGFQQGEVLCLLNFSLFFCLKLKNCSILYLENEIDLNQLAFQGSKKALPSTLLSIKKIVSMIRKYHNHKLLLYMELMDSQAQKPYCIYIPINTQPNFQE